MDHKELHPIAFLLLNSKIHMKKYQKKMDEFYESLLSVNLGIGNHFFELKKDVLGGGSSIEALDLDVMVNIATMGYMTTCLKNTYKEIESCDVAKECIVVYESLKKFLDIDTGPLKTQLDTKEDCCEKIIYEKLSTMKK